MNQAVAVQEPRPKSVLLDMADRYGMEANTFEATVRATCMAPDRNGVVPTREEFAAFLLVAKEYKLNPLTKEIYAFPKKGGGIVPVVSIDGWMNLINSHPAFDGMEFEEANDNAGNLISTRCTIYRRDRSHPTSIVEYLSETRRDTDPWKMKHRMNRHKAAIQCARYAFSFAGIYDEDEGERIAEATPQRIAAPTPPKPPAPMTIEHRAPEMELAGELQEETAEVEAPKPPVPPKPPAPTKASIAPPFDPEKALAGFRTAIDAAKDGDALADAWEIHIERFKDNFFPPDFEEASKMYRRAEEKIAP